MVKTRKADITNSGITYVIRCHSVSTISQLQQALFSIAGQQHKDVSALIAVQDLGPDELEQIKASAELITKGCGLQIDIRNFQFETVGDHRGALLNQAFDTVISRYVAVLDYDDTIYPHHAQVLIKDLQSDETQSVVASFGGCVVARYDLLDSGQIHITSKHPFNEHASVSACLVENCFPIHTFVLDRFRISEMPKFWEDRPFFEDYWFLISLLENYPVSTRCLSEPVAEYRQCNAGGNTVLTTQHQVQENPERHAQWEEAASIIHARKQPMSFKIPYSEILENQVPSNYITAIFNSRFPRSLVIYHTGKTIRKRLGLDEARLFLTSPEAYIMKMPDEHKTPFIRLIYRKLLRLSGKS